MGSNNRTINEKPVHIVDFTYDFYIVKYEVTQNEYKKLMGKRYTFFEGDNLPVANVSWWDAIKFCNSKSRKDGFKPC